MIAEPVDLICPRCEQHHQRRTPAGHPVPEPGGAVVCGSCRGRLQSVTITSKVEDEPPTFEPPGPWITDGLCSQTDPEIFHPEKGGNHREAKAICGRCPVVAECRDWAIATQQQHGVWGGLSGKERRALWAGQRAEVVAS